MAFHRIIICFKTFPCSIRDYVFYIQIFLKDFLIPHHLPYNFDIRENVHVVSFLIIKVNATITRSAVINVARLLYFAIDPQLFLK